MLSIPNINFQSYLVKKSPQRQTNNTFSQPSCDEVSFKAIPSADMEKLLRIQREQQQAKLITEFVGKFIPFSPQTDLNRLTSNTVELISENHYIGFMAKKYYIKGVEESTRKKLYQELWHLFNDTGDFNAYMKRAYNYSLKSYDELPKIPSFSLYRGEKITDAKGRNHYHIIASPGAKDNGPRVMWKNISPYMQKEMIRRFEAARTNKFQVDTGDAKFEVTYHNGKSDELSLGKLNPFITIEQTNLVRL